MAATQITLGDRPADRRIDLRWRPQDRAGWENCFIRRLHGEYVLGDLRRRLSLAHTHEPDHESDKRGGAAEILTKWIEALLEYWKTEERNDGGDLLTIYQLLQWCPLLVPFLRQRPVATKDENSQLVKNAQATFDALAGEGFSKKLNCLTAKEGIDK